VPPGFWKYVSIYVNKEISQKKKIKTSKILALPPKFLLAE
jgi:hypothetical protein